MLACPDSSGLRNEINVPKVDFSYQFVSRTKLRKGEKDPTYFILDLHANF